MQKELVVNAKLEDVNSISQKLIIEVPAENIEKSAKTALEKVKKEAKIPGFRQGKIPDAMVKQRLGNAYSEELVKQIVHDTYPEAVKLTSALPISDPRIEAETFEVTEGKPFKYSAVFEIYPKVEPVDYKGLNLEKEKISVTDEEIDAELLHIQRQMTQLEPAKDDIIGNGMLARIDFTGTAGGKKFEGSEAKDFIVDIDQKNLLPQFEKQILGMKEGEEKDVSFEYPKDYFNKDIAGLKGEFRVRVKELRKKIVPKLDDQFAKDLGKFETLSDVKKMIGERIMQAKEAHQQMHLHRRVMEELSTKQPIDVPDVMVTSELSHMLEEISHRLEAEGKTLKDANIDANSFVKNHLEEARLRARGYILLQAISDKENIQVTDEDVDQRIKSMAAQSGQTEANVKAHFEKQGLMSAMKTQLQMEKTLNFLIENAKIKEKSEKKAEKAEKSKK